MRFAPVARKQNNCWGSFIKRRIGLRFECKYKWLLGIGLIFAANPLVAATSLGPCEEKALPDFSLDIWRYFGQTDFSRATHLGLSGSNQGNYQLDTSGLADRNGRYSPIGPQLRRWIDDWTYRQVNPVRLALTETPDNPPESMLEANLAFPLHVMQSTNYINSEIAAAQVAISQQLTGRVTFFEVSRTLPESELRDQNGNLPAFIREELHSAAARVRYESVDHSLIPLGSRRRNRGPPPPATLPRFYNLKVGSAWLVSDREGDQLAALPLEDSRLLLPLDSNRFPIKFEFGRAAQTSPGAFAEIIPAAIFFALTEVLRHGLDPAQAYVFAHSLSTAHTALYRSRFGMRVYSGYRDSPQEHVLVTPLLEILQRYSIRRFSSAVHEIRIASGELLGDLDALRVLFMARDFRSETLKNSAGLELRIRDFSPLAHVRLERELYKLGLDRTRSAAVLHAANSVPITEFRDILGDFAAQEHLPNYLGVTGNYVEQNYGRFGLESLRPFLRENRALEIYLPDHPESLSAIEIADFMLLYVEDKLKNAGFFNTENILSSLRLTIAVTSARVRNPDSAYPLRERNPRFWFISRPQYFNYVNIGLGRMRVPVSDPIYLGSQAFTVEEILTWRSMQTPDSRRNLENLSTLERNHQFQLTHPEMLSP